MTAALRRVDQAALEAISQSLAPRNENSLRGFQQQVIAAAQEMLKLIEPIRTAAKGEAENIGHLVSTHIYCTHLLHTFTAHIYCTHLLRTFTAHIYCAHLLHTYRTHNLIRCKSEVDISVLCCCCFRFPVWPPT